MASGDEPTLGELSRQITALAKSVEVLSTKVLTADVWQSERQHIETRLRLNEQDIAAMQAKAETERERRDNEKREQELQAAGLRRQIIFSLLTAFVAPIFVAIVMAVVINGS